MLTLCCYPSSLVFKHGSWQGFEATSVDDRSASATDDDDDDDDDDMQVVSDEEDCTAAFDDAGFHDWYIAHA